MARTTEESLPLCACPSAHPKTVFPSLLGRCGGARVYTSKPLALEKARWPKAWDLGTFSDLLPTAPGGVSEVVASFRSEKPAGSLLCVGSLMAFTRPDVTRARAWSAVS